MKPGDTVTLSAGPQVFLTQYRSLKPHASVTITLQDPSAPGGKSFADQVREAQVGLRRALAYSLAENCRFMVEAQNAMPYVLNDDGYVGNVESLMNYALEKINGNGNQTVQVNGGAPVQSADALFGHQAAPAGQAAPAPKPPVPGGGKPAPKAKPSPKPSPAVTAAPVGPGSGGVAFPKPNRPKPSKGKFGVAPPAPSKPAAPEVDDAGGGFNYDEDPYATDAGGEISDTPLG